MPDQASPNNGGAGYAGFAQPQTPLSDFAAMAFIIQSMMGKMATATIVKVKAVTAAGRGAEPVGYVDIQPMVKQIDGAGNAYDHATIFHCPYMRLQGGTNAIILDPQVGDLGIAIFASSDISSLAANSVAAQDEDYRGTNPGSRRRYDWADALYIGGLLNGTPVQYVLFSTAGIKIESPNLVHIHAPNTYIQTELATVQASVGVDIEGGFVTVDADTLLQLSSSGAATLHAATAMGINGGTSIDLTASVLTYNGVAFDPTSVSGLPNPPPSDSPSMTTGDVVFSAPSDTTMILKRRGSDGLIYGIQLDLGLVP